MKTLLMDLDGHPTMIDITSGVCGDSTHGLQGQEEGIAEIDGIIYTWDVSCPGCIEEKLKELREEAEA